MVVMCCTMYSRVISMATSSHTSIEPLLHTGLFRHTRRGDGFPGILLPLPCVGLDL